jgi:hypothetical protein
MEKQRHRVEVRTPHPPHAQVPCGDATAALRVLGTGLSRRSTASTRANSVSSRSHAIFTLNVEHTLPGRRGGTHGLSVSALDAGALHTLRCR